MTGRPTDERESLLEADHRREWRMLAAGAVATAVVVALAVARLLWWS